MPARPLSVCPSVRCRPCLARSLPNRCLSVAASAPSSPVSSAAPLSGRSGSRLLVAACKADQADGRADRGSSEREGGREPKGRRTSESAASPSRPPAPSHRRAVQEQQKEERKSEGRSERRSESTASAAAAAADHSGPVAVAALLSSTPADVGAVLGCGGGAAWTIGRWALPLRLLGDVEVEFMDRFAVRTEVRRRPPLLSS